jgi:hypothetical protein
LFEQTRSRTNGASGPTESYFGTNVSFTALDGAKSSKSLSVPVEHVTMKKHARGVAVDLDVSVTVKVLCLVLVISDNA